MRVVGAYSLEELRAWYPPDQFKLTNPNGFLSIEGAFSEVSTALTHSEGVADQQRERLAPSAHSTPVDSVAEADTGADHVQEADKGQPPQREAQPFKQSTVPHADVPHELRRFDGATKQAKEVHEVLRTSGRFVGADRSAPVSAYQNEDFLRRTSHRVAEAPPHRLESLTSVVSRSADVTRELLGAEGTHFKTLELLDHIPSDDPKFQVRGQFEWYTGKLTLRKDVADLVQSAAVKGSVNTTAEYSAISTLLHEQIHGVYNTMHTPYETTARRMTKSWRRDSQSHSRERLSETSRLVWVSR